MTIVEPERTPDEPNIPLEIVKVLHPHAPTDAPGTAHITLLLNRSLDPFEQHVADRVNTNAIEVSGRQAVVRAAAFDVYNHLEMVIKSLEKIQDEAKGLAKAASTTERVARDAINQLNLPW